MRFLHTSDWHLGITFKARSAKEDQDFFITQILEIIREKKADALILAG